MPVGELPHRLAAVVKELRELKKAKPAAAGAALSADDLLARAEAVGGTRIIVADARGSDAGAMRQRIDLRIGRPMALRQASAWRGGL
ncbi:MAG: hypothetical protein FJ309_15510 [Planctomycetes bacterium]|nr:hypothetical protein [Planctomycetota bacterium]